MINKIKNIRKKKGVFKNCKKQIYVFPYRMKTNNFCSIKCSMKNLRKYNEVNGIWNKGKKNIWSKEILKKISEAAKGRIPWNKNIKGYHIHTEEHKEKLRKSFIGNKLKQGSIPWNKGLKGKDNILYGIKRSEEVKEKIRKTLTNHPCYQNKSRFKKQSESLKKWYKQNPEAIERFKERRQHIKIPKKDSTIEVKIQNFLKQLKIEYFTHQHIKIEHGYQCDILIPSLNLVIECDGDYWHKYPIGNDIDHIRTKELIEKGFKVLRLWEFEIRSMKLNEFEKILGEK